MTLMQDEAPDTLAEGLDAQTAENLSNYGGSPPEPGVALFGAAPPSPAYPLAIDIAAMTAFLEQCESSAPRVTYALGAKVGHATDVPGRDFHSVDCSGFVRQALLRSTHPVVPFPDGSVTQHDWVAARGFPTATVADGKRDDGKVRIAFLSPTPTHKIGHVVLLHRGATLESHSQVGPDSRPWTGEAWQGETHLFELTA